MICEGSCQKNTGDPQMHWTLRLSLGLIFMMEELEGRSGDQRVDSRCSSCHSDFLVLPRGTVNKSTQYPFPTPLTRFFLAEKQDIWVAEATGFCGTG
jgi:hypothetical protein